MREIIFDTETTGLKPEEGERIIEIGAIEFVNRFPTGRTFHEYLNPEGRQVDPEALRVHGISNEDLKDKKPFREIATEFLEFVGDANLVAHNASFDMNFVNHELARLDMAPFDPERVVDTLEIARRKHPMARNSLDRLCERYGINNKHRKLHGALLDAELLSEVYLELLGGRQTSLELEASSQTVAVSMHEDSVTTNAVAQRTTPLSSNLSPEEELAHREFVEELGEAAIWNRYSR